MGAFVRRQAPHPISTIHVESTLQQADVALKDLAGRLSESPRHQVTPESCIRRKLDDGARGLLEHQALSLLYRYRHQDQHLELDLVYSIRK